MNTWFPQWKALWMAENCTNTMHNILTLRGAQVRDALKWASYLDETIALYGGAEIKFQSHHWPVWGNARVIEYLGKQKAKSGNEFKAFKVMVEESAEVDEAEPPRADVLGGGMDEDEVPF